MLYRVIIGNYTSFEKPVQFDMFPNMRRENFLNHVYEFPDGIPVLKSCALYGANGSGKSNFVSALKFIKEFATDLNLDSNPNRLSSVFKRSRFKLPEMGNDTPMSFLIEFGGKLGVYIYTVELNDKGIVEEALYKSGVGKKENEILFCRHTAEISFPDGMTTEEIKKVFIRQLKSNPSQSALAFIGKLHLIDNASILDAYEWINTQLDIIEVNHQLPWLIDQLRHQPDVFEFIKTVFSNIGLGIEDMIVKEESFDDWLKYADMEDKATITKFMDSIPQNAENKSFTKMNRQFPLLTVKEEDGKRIVSELLFYQLGKNGFIGELGCEAQSSGTLRLLTLVPAIYYAIYEGKTVVIDEIDHSIHSVLIKELIKFFGEAKSNGQLIFTTHETALLNQQELLRPDEVWMIEKSEGISQMYSLNDFKIHKTLSLENGYLDGRFGAIPFLGHLNLLKDES
ncbi:MAG: ATP-binding protein [Muribaculaceae bacterium]|nr:ATP-binding protein [Muribaculaceae bacterium]